MTFKICILEFIFSLVLTKNTHISAHEYFGKIIHSGVKLTRNSNILTSAFYIFKSWYIYRILFGQLQFDKLNSNLYHFRLDFYFYFCSESNSNFIFREVLWATSFMPLLATLHNYTWRVFQTVDLVLHFMVFQAWDYLRQGSIF